MNKKALYERIMTNVAKEVKKSLNEARYAGSFSQPGMQEVFYKLGERIMMLKKLPAEIDNAYMCGQFAPMVLEHCMGYILEAYVLNALSRMHSGITVVPTNNGLYGADLHIDTDFLADERDYNGPANHVQMGLKLEIKAFKDGKKSNITFTANQLKEGALDDVCLVYIDYSLVDGGKRFIINDILVAEPGTVKVSRHGGETMKMVSIAQDLEDGKFINRLGNNVQWSRAERRQWQEED